jgi:archaellum component FlaC
MADEPDNIVLVMLRRMDDKLDRIDSRLDRPSEDMRDLKARVTHLEEGQAGIHRRLNRIDERLDRAERRLELSSQPGFAE